MTLEDRVVESIIEAGAADDTLRWQDCLATIADEDGEKIADEYGIKDDKMASRLMELMCRAYNQQIDWDKVTDGINEGYRNHLEILDAMFN